MGSIIEKLNVKGSANVPEIVLDPKNNIFEITGTAKLNKVRGFSSSYLLGWFEQYAKTPNLQTNLKINLDYFDFPSSKLLWDILSQLETISADGNDVKITWCYKKEDDDMLEAGEEYESLVNLPFEKICVN